MSDCHPDRIHHCKGMCKKCYTHSSHIRRMKDAQFRFANAARSRAWALANPERAYLLDTNKHLVKKYGITYAEYQIMLKNQGSLCALCNKPEAIVTKKRVSRLAVDHCHKTQRVRGLLCFKCNTSIAFIEANEGMMDKIRNYLSV